MIEFEERKLYDLQQVAEETGVLVSNLRYWANRGQIPAKKYGRAWMMTGAAVKYFLEHGTEQEQEPDSKKKELKPEPEQAQEQEQRQKPEEICRVCGKSFIRSGRSIYCSQNCRQRAYRQRQKEREQKE